MKKETRSSSQEKRLLPIKMPKLSPKAKSDRRISRYSPALGSDENLLVDLDLVQSSVPGTADNFMALRVLAHGFGEQRMYNSKHAIMWARRTCYMFVRPRSQFLELVFFVLKEIEHPLINRTTEVSKTKIAHVVKLDRNGMIRAPLARWLKEAFEYSG